MAPMCQSVQYILTQSYVQLSYASYYISVYHDNMLITNTDNIMSLSTSTYIPLIVSDNGTTYCIMHSHDKGMCLLCFKPGKHMQKKVGTCLVS